MTTYCFLLLGHKSPQTGLPQTELSRRTFLQNTDQNCKNKNVEKSNTDVNLLEMKSSFTVHYAAIKNNTRLFWEVRRQC